MKGNKYWTAEIKCKTEKKSVKPTAYTENPKETTNLTPGSNNQLQWGYGIQSQITLIYSSNEYFRLKFFKKQYHLK